MMRILVNERTNCSSRVRRQKKMPRTLKLNDLRRVTAAELCAVNLATIREGVNHCRWPKEVIERFLAVEL
jgi:hypothetical protein